MLMIWNVYPTDTGHIRLPYCGQCAKKQKT